MLTKSIQKSQIDNVRQLHTAAFDQEFVASEAANNAEYAGRGMAPPSSRSRRAARLRRQTRSFSGGWRARMGSW